MSSQAIDEELFRAELERILQSPEFSSSRLFQKFLRYTTDRAIEGAAQIDQTEIAANVLGRDSSFNPVEDASVRKLASHVRHRLEQYYARCRDSSVVVTLPVRSYVPRLEPNTPPPQLTVNTVEVPRPRWTVIVGSALCVALIFAGVWQCRSHSMPKTFSIRVIPLVTARGDISNHGADAIPQSIMLGSQFGAEDSVMAKMDFTASQEAQQAGLLVWINEDNYIQLGRRFVGRNQLVFFKEEAGVPVYGAKSVTFDPEGQSGRPIWLLIKRRRDLYEGFTSFDSIHWDRAGDPIQATAAFQKVRIGLYALNGRREAATAKANFTHFSTGSIFGQQVSDLKSISGQWSRGCTCGDDCREDFDRFTMRLSFTESQSTCWAQFTRPLAKNDWVLTTKLDYTAEPGTSAGIGVKGTNGAVRLVRYFLNRPSLAIIYDGKWLDGIADLNGNPAIYLRLTSSHGTLTGAFSADGERYISLPRSVPVAELGDRLSGGIKMNINSVEGVKREAKFYFLQMEADRLSRTADAEREPHKADRGLKSEREKLQAKGCEEGESV